MKTMERGTPLEDVLKEASAMYGGRGDIEKIETKIGEYGGNGWRTKMHPYGISFENADSGEKHTYHVVYSETGGLTLAGPEKTHFKTAKAKYN